MIDCEFEYSDNLLVKELMSIVELQGPVSECFMSIQGVSFPDLCRMLIEVFAFLAIRLVIFLLSEYVSHLDCLQHGLI